MRPTYVARNASVAAVADEVSPRSWEFDRAPAQPARDRAKPTDELSAARGILVAVGVGVFAWIGLGWGAMIAFDRIFG